MNQVLKERVYNRGTKKQAEFIAERGGMTDEEKTVFMMLHDGRTEIYVQEELGLSRTAYCRIEESISAKVLLAVFECINWYYEYKTSGDSFV